MKINKLFLLTTIILAFKISAMEEELRVVATQIPMEEHPVLHALRTQQKATVREWLVDTQEKLSELFTGQKIELKALEIYNPRTQTIQVAGSINGTPAVFFFNKDGSYRSFALPGVRSKEIPQLPKRDLKSKTIFEEEGE